MARPSIHRRGALWLLVATAVATAVAGGEEQARLRTLHHAASLAGGGPTILRHSRQVVTMPEAQAIDFDIATPTGADRTIELRSNVVIPDDSELNWPVSIMPSQANFSVKNITVLLRGLYHERASDLRITLRHGNRKAVLADRCCGKHAFGRPRARPHRAETPGIANNEVDYLHVKGDGYNYYFEDLVHPAENLALGMNATQSSTQYGAATVATRATDGDTNGFFGGGSVTHTRGQSRTPWWQVDLASGCIPERAGGSSGCNATVGTIKVWGPQKEDDLPEVQLITTRSPNLFTTGTFKLRLVHNGQNFTTAPIPHNAMPSIAAANADGTSMQAALEAIVGAGGVRVTRSANDGLGHAGSSNGYDWSVTFVNLHGNLVNLVPVEIDIGTGATIAVRELRPGSSSLFFKRWTGATGMWIFVLPDSDDVDAFMSGSSSGDLHTARSLSVFQKRIEAASSATDASGTQAALERELTLALPTLPMGRHIRVQLESETDAFLLLAEVQVFATVPRTLEHYTGGTPVRDSIYEPRQSLVEALSEDRFVDDGAGNPHPRSDGRTGNDPGSAATEPYGAFNAHGLWTLSITDLVAGKSGGLDDWVLYLRGTGDGGVEETVVVRPHIVARIDTLPKYGKLYEYSPTATPTTSPTGVATVHHRGALIEAVHELRQYQGGEGGRGESYARTWGVAEQPEYDTVFNRLVTWGTAAQSGEAFNSVNRAEQLAHYTAVYEGGRCYGNCERTFHQYSPLSTNQDGSKAGEWGLTYTEAARREGGVRRPPPRTQFVEGNRRIVYVPPPRFLGKDPFTYTVNLGNIVSERATVAVTAQKCRGRTDCQNEWFDDYRALDLVPTQIVRRVVGPIVQTASHTCSISEVIQYQCWTPSHIVSYTYTKFPDTDAHPTHIESTHASVDTTAAKTRVRSTAHHAGLWLTGRRRLLGVTDHGAEQAAAAEEEEASGSRSSEKARDAMRSFHLEGGATFTAHVQAHQDGHYIPHVSVRYGANVR